MVIPEDLTSGIAEVISPSGKQWSLFPHSGRKFGIDPEFHTRWMSKPLSDQAVRENCPGDDPANSPLAVAGKTKGFPFQKG
jgi:hypothetical protein